ncbi:hypothetical protein T492DRAFT_833944 [Pavlovales sp. CCMP2436]|nr:hypothetical protein T492DRAFT_833944 [Pavlovales sp. CCMP2436]
MSVVFAQPSPAYFALLWAAALACHIYGKRDALHYGIVLIACPALWTFQEYGIHRVLMHGAIAVIKQSHMGHHKHPTNLDRLFIPCVFTTVNAVVNALVYFALFGKSAALASVTGNVICYTAFEWAHAICHNGHSSRLTRDVRTHHLAHHFVKQRPCNFGFTSATWDLVFGTYYSKHPLGAKALVLLCPWPLLPFMATSLGWRKTEQN